MIFNLFGVTLRTVYFFCMKKLLLVLFLGITFSLSAQTDSETPVSIPKQEKSITIFPNPATSHVNIITSKKNAEIASISVYSIIGTEVMNLSFGKNSPREKQLNIYNLKKGKYIVRVIFTNGSIEVSSLIKQ